MTRDIERWWVLHKLQEATDRNIDKIPHEHLVAGGVQFNGRDEFVEWLADSSLNQCISRPFKLWSYKIWLFGSRDAEQKKKLRARFCARRINFYNSLVSSCIESNLILIYKKNEIKHLHTSPSGDDFVSEYWHKKTWKNTIGTAVIIAALIWFITDKVGGLFKHQENQIYHIQVVPYEGTQR